MEYKELGNTGYRVSEIGLGTSKPKSTEGMTMQQRNGR